MYIKRLRLCIHSQEKLRGIFENFSANDLAVATKDSERLEKIAFNIENFDLQIKKIVETGNENFDFSRILSDIKSSLTELVEVMENSGRSDPAIIKWARESISQIS